jgi:hypothetical protein
VGRCDGAPPVERGWDLAGFALAAALSAYGVALVAGVVYTGHPHGGVGASLGVIAMTVPVLWARRAPLLAAVCLGVAAPINVAAFGSLVGCGAALPAVFYVMVCLGVPRWSWRAGIGSLFAIGSLATQTVYDPKLGAETLPVFVVIAAAFYGCGRLVGQRIEAVSTLRQHNAELIEQRERLAALSITIERDRVAGQLDFALVQALHHILALSTEGRDLLTRTDPGIDRSVEAQATFAEIEDDGRRALTSMRAVLTGLHRLPHDDSALAE